MLVSIYATLSWYVIPLGIDLGLNFSAGPSQQAYEIKLPRSRIKPLRSCRNRSPLDSYKILLMNVA